MSQYKPKTTEELKLMRKGASILREAQEAVKRHLKPGAILLDLDRIAEEVIRSHDALPAFKGFHGFPSTLCTMVNSEIVHGIPDSRAVKAGDLISIDCGVIYKNLITDAAFTEIVGGDETNPKRAKFSQCVYQALVAGCEAAKTGNTTGDIGHAIEQKISAGGYNLVKEYTGHGVGHNMHEDPHIFNYGKPGKGDLLIEGMTICIEPIVSIGNPKNKTLSDKWTVVTLDGKDACQWEHCGVVTDEGLEIFV